MNVVDELVVLLKLDGKNFKKGADATKDDLTKVKGEAAKTAKGLQESGKKGSEFFTGLQKSALKFFGVMAIGTAGFRAFSNLIASGAHLSRLSKNLGTTADSIHKWGQAVKQSGGTAQGFEGTLRGLSAEITAWKTGGTAGPMLQGLQALGVGLVDTEGKAKSLEALLLDMGQAVQRRVPGRADQANLLQSWGLDEGTVNLILQKRKDAEALIAKQPGMDNAAAEKAQKINEQWEALLERVRGKVRELAIQHFPTIEKAVIAIAGAFDRMSPVITKMVDGFTSLNKMSEGWLGSILLALGAIRLIAGGGFIGGAAKAAGGAAAGAVGASVGAALMLKGDTAPDQEGAKGLQDKAHAGDREAALKLARIQLNNQIWRKLFGKPATDEEVRDRSFELLGKHAQSMTGKIGPASKGATLNQIAGENPKADGLSEDARAKISAAEKAAGLPAGLISSVIKQETGGKQEYIDDPSKYHYEKNAEGKRIAGHTGKASTAFGPFGLLESTAANPGYGVQPLQDKSFEEQLRFMSQYLAARTRNAGDLFGGLSGYGEGPKYASQVLGRLPGGGAMTGLPRADATASGQAGRTISIGKIDITTAATDAAGIARSLKDELVRNMNYGVQ